MKRPRVSVVIASLVGTPFIDECLASLERQAAELEAEVIVVACGPPEYTEGIARKVPWVRVIHRAERETVPELRKRGVEEASGEVIAIIEEHCVAAPDWLVRALDAHACGKFGVVGGPVVDNAYTRLRDWVVYFIEYNNSLPPWRDGEEHELNGANIAYTRGVLLKYREFLSGGYWEASLHPRLMAGGVKFRAAPEMLVHHRGPFDYGYYLRQRYWFSRAYAGARSQHLPASRKMVYLVAAPLAPFLLLARMAARVLARRCRVKKFALSIPLLIPALFAYVAGECMGYLAGPGEALSKVE
jgi:glycosyltransferase involved in cell wall biosynthesis